MTLSQKIQKLAKSHKNGFTCKIIGDEVELVYSGYCVAFEYTQNSFDTEGLEKCIAHAIENEGFIGGWFNTENNKFYFDSVKIFKDKIDAFYFAEEQKQIAFFHLDSLTEFYTQKVRNEIEQTAKLEMDRMKDLPTIVVHMDEGAITAIESEIEVRVVIVDSDPLYDDAYPIMGANTCVSQWASNRPTAEDWEKLRKEIRKYYTIDLGELPHTT